MSNIRALIVDDEPLARRGIRQMLAREPDVVVVGECRDGRDALRSIEALSPDVVFLDVQMPEVDGFGMIQTRGDERMPLIVFVTAYEEHAVRAFEAQALDYLVKPLHSARFRATMVRVRERLRLTAAAGAEPPRRVVVPTANGSLVIDGADIDWIEADDYYACLHVGSARHLVRESLASLRERLDPAQFVRVHRGALVRVDRIREVRALTTGQAVVILRDGTRVTVSRRQKASLDEVVRAVGCNGGTVY